MNKESLKDKIFDIGLEAGKTAITTFDPTGVSGVVLETIAIDLKKKALEKRWRSFLLGLSKDIKASDKDSIEKKLLKFGDDDKLSEFIHKITEDLKTSETAEMAPIIKGILAGKFLSEPDSFDEVDRGILKMIGHLDDIDFEWFKEFFTKVTDVPEEVGHLNERDITFNEEPFHIFDRKISPDLRINLESSTCNSGEYNAQGLEIPSLELSYVWREFVEKIKLSGFFRIATSFGPDKSFPQGTINNPVKNRNLNSTGTLVTKIDLVCEKEGIKRTLELIELAELGIEKLLSEKESHH